MNRQILAIIFIVALVVSYAYAFTSLGRAPWNCPPVHWGLGNPYAAKIPFNIVGIGDQYQPYAETGTIVWCIYGNFGILQKSYLTNRILSIPESSSDGQYVAAVGYQIAPGRGGSYVNGAVYLFDKDGEMKWSISTSQPLFSVHINGNGSAIVVVDPVLWYLNREGKVLCNYSKYEARAAVIVNDGSKVVAGISQILFPNHLNYGSEVAMFDARGNLLWNFTILDQTFNSPADLAVSNGHIVAGVSFSGYNGTLYSLDLQGNLIWSRHVNSAILIIVIEIGGSTISVETNWGQVKLDIGGNVIGNETAPH